MSPTVIVWLLDDREMRRSAVSSFLAEWSARKAIDLRVVKTLQDITPPNDTQRELCILSTGGTSLDDFRMAALVCELMERLAGRPLVILTDIDTADETHQALEIGADALLSTALKSSIAVAALDFVLSGGSYFPRADLVVLSKRQTVANQSEARSRSSGKIAWSVMDNGRDPRSLDRLNGRMQISDTVAVGPNTALTPRQAQIVAFLKKGRTNKQIARLLDISEATVKAFVGKVMKKFGARNRTEVALLAADLLDRDNIVYRPGTTAHGSDDA